jgi:hypothetical protein
VCFVPFPLTSFMSNCCLYNRFCGATEMIWYVCMYVHWTKLMQILKVTGIDWLKRRLISKPCMDQSVKLRTDHAEKRCMKCGRGVSQRCCLSLILLKETKGRTAVTGRWGRNKQLFDDIKEEKRYSKKEQEAEDCTLWRNHLEVAMDLLQGKRHNEWIPLIH